MDIKAIHYKEDRKFHEHSALYPYLIIFDGTPNPQDGVSHKCLILQESILGVEMPARMTWATPKWKTEKDDSRLGKQIEWNDIPAPHQTFVVMVIESKNPHRTVRNYDKSADKLLIRLKADDELEAEGIPIPPDRLRFRELLKKTMDDSITDDELNELVNLYEAKTNNPDRYDKILETNKRLISQLS